MARSSRLSDLEKDELVALYTSGVNTREILQTYGIAVGSLYRVLEQRGVNRNRTNRTTEPAVTPKALQVTVNAEQFVERVDPVETVRGHKSMWEIRYTGTLQVEAESIDQALQEARRHAGVRRIYHVRLLT